MADKPEAKEAAPAAPAKAGAAKAPPPDKAAPADKNPAADKSAPAAAASPGSGKLGLIAAAAAVVLAPALSFGVAQFVLLPRLEKKLALPVAATAGGEAAQPAEASGAEAKGGKPAPPTYEFTNVVVHLAGTMGTRYLKTSFIVTGSESGLHGVFDTNKARLTDVTLNVLSALTLADLEEPGSKNVLREKLVAAYNQALGRKVADQVYFSDFVVQ